MKKEHITFIVTGASEGNGPFKKGDIFTVEGVYKSTYWDQVRYKIRSWFRFPRTAIYFERLGRAALGKDMIWEDEDWD